ncbi:MAG: hypothetical protein JST86_03375 [Bacteroidetes bacterium]|nr:hypothetical protein [Bacteroidota bacterium]
MKKAINLLSVTLVFCINSLFAQSANSAVPGGGGSGSNCTCTAPASSTCNASCTFSDCCICWNPNTQTGACGCYLGVASCKNQNNSASSGMTMGSSQFGVVNPDANISFHFEKFSKLFAYFKSKGIKADALQTDYNSVKSKYTLTGQKIHIANDDLGTILAEYSKIIDTLDDMQKADLNIFIKSLN